jgi:hypothetical protein
MTLIQRIGADLFWFLSAMIRARTRHPRSNDMSFSAYTNMQTPFTQENPIL